MGTHRGPAPVQVRPVRRFSEDYQMTVRIITDSNGRKHITNEPLLHSPAQPVPHAVIAGALFDFMGWLTSRPKRIMLSSVDDASPAADAIKDFAKMRGLSLDEARVQDWQDNIKENT